MMVLYFDGYSESAIAHRLKIDQGTVSLYVSKFKFLAEQQGLKAAGQEFGVMHEVEELHSLAVELKKSKLTIEEAKLGSVWLRCMYEVVNCVSLVYNSSYITGFSAGYGNSNRGIFGRPSSHGSGFIHWWILPI
jgi:predicted transcriptional regulator